MILFAATTCLVTLFTAFGPLAAVAVLLGLTSGMPSSLVVVMLRDIILPSEAAAATGLLFFCWGVGDVSGAFVAGFLFDTTNSYDYSFYCSGAATLVAGLLALVVYLLIEVKRRRRGAKPTAAIALENPGFDAGNEQNLPDGEPTTNDGAASPSHGMIEAINPLYFMQQGEGEAHPTGVSDECEGPSDSSHGNSSLPTRYRQRQEHEYRLEMSSITKLDYPCYGGSCQNGNGVDTSQEVQDTEGPNDTVIEPAMDHGSFVNSATSFENPTFSEEPEMFHEDYYQASPDMRI